MTMKIHCKYDALVKITDLKLNPKNPNRHPKSQIKRLAAILSYQGWRFCIKVSKQSGMVSTGHGRIQAAQLNKWEEVPVVYQDYETPEMEFQDLVGDNAIGHWSELDLNFVAVELGNFDSTKLDVDLLGIEKFTLEMPDNFNKEDGLDKEMVEVLVKVDIEHKDELIQLLDGADFPTKYDLQHVREKIQ